MTVTTGLLPVLPTPSLAQQVPPGFEVELLYAVPDIEHPSTVTCDDDGNLFVGEDPMDMRGPSTRRIDRIVYIRWSTSGGPPVKTVFCENLSAVFGMIWHQDALYVMNAPYYTMLKDTDGDGVADVRRELLSSLGHAPGFFGLNNHVSSGMHLGLDGLLYCSVGDKGIPRAVGVDGSTLTLEGGGVFRMRPNGTELEIVSRGIRNHLDVALDPLDNMFAYDNDDDFGWWTRLIHHVPMGYYGYPYDYRSRPDRHLPPIREFGGGTPCGGDYYREAAWPAPYRGSLFFCEWGESKIERFTLTRKGASFEARVEDFMLGDGSGAFRPIDLCFSPDGKHMYVADWNVADGGKPNRVGRLFRVTHLGRDVPPEPPRARDTDPLENQIFALGHPSHHERLRAQHRLAAMGEAAAEPVSRLLESNATPQVKVHAIWTQNALIDRLDGYDPLAQWIAALRDPAADVRGQAVRALGYRRAQTAVPALADALQDPDAGVRMRAAAALGRIGQAGSADPLFDALGEQDRFARFTMIQALRAINNWEPALSHLRAANPETRAAILRALTGVYDVGAVSVLAQWFRQADEALERVAALNALAEVHRRADPYVGGWWGPKAAAGKPARPKEHPWAGTAIVAEAMEAGLRQSLSQVRAAALEALREVPAPTIVPSVRRLAYHDPEEEVRRKAIRLLAHWKDAEFVASLLGIAADPKSGDPLRREAVHAVVAIGAENVDKQLAEIARTDDVSIHLATVLLDALATIRTPKATETIEEMLDDPRPGVRIKAIQAYAQARGDDAVSRILSELGAPDVSVRRAALSTLGRLGSRRAVPAMIAAAADSSVRLEAIRALAAIPDRRALTVYLDGLLHEQPAIREASRHALIALGDSIGDDLRSLHDRNELPALARQALVEAFSTAGRQHAFLSRNNPAILDPSVYAQFAADHSGDARRGQRLFADPDGIGCIKCHAVGGIGATFGPDLLGVGAKYPRHELIRCVLEPSNRVLTDYEMLIVTTTSGRIHQGFVKSQTADRIELVTREGEVIQIRSNEIEVKQISALSPMPNGLADGLTPQGFADIIAYLESLGQP